MDSRLTKDFMAHLDELGLWFDDDLELSDLPASETAPTTLIHEHGRARFQVGYSDSLTVSSLEWAKAPWLAGERVLIFGPRVTERSAALLRHMGINYLDRAGNAFIVFAGVHIDIRGRRAPVERNRDAQRGTRGGVNLFSTKRSQVIFAILTWPELLERPIRELAATAGVSLGQAQETLELLTQYGYLDDRRKLVERLHDRLIDQWAAGFHTGLGAPGNTSCFTGGLQDLDHSDSPAYVSGESALPELLRPETLVLYTEGLPTELIRSQRWRKDTAHPNIFLRNRFWRSPKPAIPGFQNAPWLLVYADLLASNDGRQQEAAEDLRALHR